MKSRLLIASVAFLGVASPAWAQTIVNGGFETPTVPAGQYSYFYPGDTALTGWSIDTPYILLVSSSYTEGNLVFNSHSGAAAVDLTGAGLQPGSIHTDVNTTAGQMYHLQFWVGNATTNGSFQPYYTTPSYVTLYIDGAQVGTFTNSDVTMNGVNWKCFSYNFTGTGALQHIKFGNANTNDNYAGLDDVSLTAITSVSTISYTYDALGRVTGVATSGGANNGVVTGYSYDAAGNRTQVTTTGSSGC